MSTAYARTIVRTVAQYSELGLAVEAAALAKFDRAMYLYQDNHKAISVALAYVRNEQGIVGHSFGTR